MNLIKKKNNNKDKRNCKYEVSFIIIVFVIIVFIFIINLIFNYNFLKFGNNNHKKIKNRTIEELIKNTKEYSAESIVRIKSNKTENCYNVKEYVNDDISKYEVIDGNLIVENKDEKIIIKSKIDLTNEKIFKIKDKFNNNLFLSSFINDLEIIIENEDKNIENEFKNIKIEETENEIVLKIKNTYGIKKILYIKKKENNEFKIVRLEILDDVQNIDICIEYKYIELK